MARALVWFRRDLRLDDNPAWSAATRECDEVLPVFVLDPTLLDAAGPFRRDAVLGAVVIAMIENGLGLLNVSAGTKYIVTGLVLLAAVTLDSLSRRKAVATGRA